MRLLPALAALLLCPAFAHASWFGPSSQKFVSSYGDFEAEVPKGWSVERHSGDSLQNGCMDHQFKDDGSTKFVRTIFRDPERSEYALVVDWYQYGASRRRCNGLVEYYADLEMYKRDLLSGYGFLPGTNARKIPWSYGPYKLQMVMRAATYEPDPSPAAADGHLVFASGAALVGRTAWGVHYHTIIGRSNGFYDLIYPEPADADPAVLKRYKKLLDSFTILADGPAAGLGAKAREVAARSAPKPAPAAVRETLTYADGRGTLVMPGGLEARPRVLKRIGEVCSTKNVGLVAGREHLDGGVYRVDSEKIEGGSFRVDFVCLY